MTQLRPGEDLEASGPRWNGGVEWGRSVRHWWRIHPDQPIFTHRASGEQIAYLGSLGTPDWHRFDYRHEGATYPLAVQMKRVWWPNPDAGQRLPPRYDERSPAELALHVWRVDHCRSANLWRNEVKQNVELGSEPPYWLWRRADQAIIDAALLWPRGHPSGLRAASDVAVNGGWLNGSWSDRFFRLLRRCRERYLCSHIAIPRMKPATSIRQQGLPLPDYRIPGGEIAPPRWVCTLESAFDLHGHRPYRRALMTNPVDDAAVVVSSGSIQQVERLPWPVLVVLRDKIAWATRVQAHGRGSDPEILLPRAAEWTVLIDHYCSITHDATDSKPTITAWLGKPVAAFDGIGRATLPSYDPTVIRHPLSSYQSWRFLYDCFLNALPFCPGFEEEDFGSDMIHGDVGQLTVVGGFVGGIQGLTTELRLNVELPSDTENTAWTKFFS